MTNTNKMHIDNMLLERYKVCVKNDSVGLKKPSICQVFAMDEEHISIFAS